MTEELMALKDAQKYLGVSKAKMWRLAKGLPIYTDPLDKRKKLVPRAEIEKLKQPRASEEELTSRAESKALWNQPAPSGASKSPKAESKEGEE